MCFVLALVLVHAGGVARAQDSATSDTDARYRSVLKDALAEYDANHFEEARILFRRAHQINPNARTLRSIGMASFELRDYVAAVRALTAALVDPRKPLTPEMRTHAQRLLERSRMFVDIYALKIAPSDARVVIDGKVPDLEPDGTVLLGFGSHGVEVSKPGFVVRTLVVNVRGGEHKTLTVTLQRRPEPMVRQPTVGGLAEKQPAPPANNVLHGGGHARAIWLIAAGGTALVSAGAGALWWFQNNEITSCANPPQDYQCNNRSAILSKRNLAVGATIVTGAAAITMAVIGILSRKPEAQEPAPASELSCAVSPSGFLCTRAF